MLHNRLQNMKRNIVEVDPHGFEDLYKDVVEVPGSAVVQDKSRFIATCSYSIDIYKDIMKAQVHVSRLVLL
ncbi:hypothetical protein Tco_1495818 [Tanacetum coccineum]